MHREAELPHFASQTLTARAQKETVAVNAEAPAYGQRKAVLYATCSMNYNDPDLGWLTRQVLAKLGVETEIVYPACCGMPQLEQGLIGDVVANARKVALAMQEWIAKGYDIVALVPSCALMLKQEWPLLVPENDPARPAGRCAGQGDVRPHGIRRRHRQEAGLAPGLMPLAGPVALHLACHARAQNMGAKAADMLRLLPQAQDITVIERCSGHGGSWGVKEGQLRTALKVGKPATRKAAEVLESAAEKNQQGFVASECPLAAAHIVQGISRPVRRRAAAACPPLSPHRNFRPELRFSKGRTMKHEITAADILPLEAYERVRDEKRRAVREVKANRRVSVGPYATFYFENYDTMWLQVQEMLRIEKGGEAQLADELEAYNPMIPKGNELTATVMFEIENPDRRREVAGAARRRRAHDRIAMRRRGCQRRDRARSRIRNAGRQGVVGAVPAFPLRTRAGREVLRARCRDRRRGDAPGIQSHRDHAAGREGGAGQGPWLILLRRGLSAPVGRNCESCLRA